MSPLWVRRFCIRVVDSLYGSFLYFPLAVLFLKRSVTGFGTGEWDESQIPKLDGKVALVTGGNAGIGYYTVKQLASRGAKVYLGARSESRAKAAIKRLLEETPSVPQENIAWLRLDLSNQAQVVDAAVELRSKEQRLDILVNNAGIDPYDYVRTADGFEMTMAVNHVGHWTLTYCLLPLLKATAAQEKSDVRVVTVSSSGEAYSSPTNHFTSPKDLDDPCASPGWENSCLGQAMRYGTTKLANVLFASELQRRMDEDDANIISLSLNPGTVRTDGAADVMPFMVRPLVYLLFTAPERGADTSLFAATAKDVKENSEQWKGRYLDGPGKIKEPSLRARNAVAGRNLWNITESAVRAIGVLDRL
ncbi:uncharacterized protein BKA55DRAFT_723558 [Fusarium redolens]|uniref:Oxidoreductase n=1 Tax=Fusarium redolens TaxID=48865 RepID=A0A9P9HJQ0_FUSRE|nr:uncharacterized protein BKA55DRAFT_723558 [Fusarium redolens]KAH7258850.1 hypothetical protein BKA55DRAFT_723558 [Fusarium redolens]